MSGFLWSRNIKLSSPVSYAVPRLERVGFAMVLATAYYGGPLVYDLGVNAAQTAS